MTRTVADLKQMFAVTAGYDAGDPVSAPVPLRHVSSEELKRVRIGYFEDDDRTPVTPETRGALRQARESLVGQGFEVVEFRPEGLEPDAARVHETNGSGSSSLRPGSTRRVDPNG
jgi:Asp-tRNA(Asn)/Glu-tRNA(Gln) amidotransferase A subunit family amidase